MSETNFRSRLVGYSARRVNAAMENQRREMEDNMARQQERLLALREENKALTEEVSAYRERETDITRALVDAQAQARIITEQGREEAAKQEEEARERIEDLRAAAARNRLELERIADQVMTLATGFCEQISQLGQQLQEAEEPAKPLRLDAPAARRVRRG